MDLGRISKKVGLDGGGCDGEIGTFLSGLLSELLRYGDGCWLVVFFF